MKKSIIALALSVVMVLAMMVPAFAAQPTVGSTATCDIKCIVEEAWVWTIPSEVVLNATNSFKAEETVSISALNNALFISTYDDGIAIVIDTMSGSFGNNISYTITATTTNVHADGVANAVLSAFVGETVTSPSKSVLSNKLTFKATVDSTKIVEASDNLKKTVTFSVVSVEKDL